MTEFWEGLGRSARAGLIVGVVSILLATSVFAWWILRSDYQVLFSDLKPQDATAMSAELEKLKIPYRLDEATGSILVDKAQVHPTRIKLMGKEMPLQGAVGFELFNNTDFGMTEFAQKINYQRALQGELTRTISSLSEIREVRVHLALPEQGLFKQANVRPKAAITLSLKEGQALRPAQVSGIQRLVAAATPGMTAQDVTVVDKQGVALSRSPEEPVDGPVTSTGGVRLELKKDTEQQLAKKATAVLEQAFGKGQALASVDVTLNMDHVRVTTEDVIPAPSRSSDSRGVIVKERESMRDTASASSTEPSRPLNGTGSSTQREVDYQVGRRTEQVTSQAGSIRKIQVVAVVRQSLDAAQEDKVRRMLAAAVGASAERGDLVVVQSLNALVPSAAASSAGGSVVAELPTELQDAPSQTSRSTNTALAEFSWGYARILGVLLLIVIALVVIIHAARRRLNQPAPLSDAERQAALRKVQAWMQAGDHGPVALDTAGVKR